MWQENRGTIFLEIYITGLVSQDLKEKILWIIADKMLT